MSIDYANSKVTMDFTYNNDRSTYFIRFHSTEQHGLTISISTDGVEYLDLPADMFVEVSEFLIEKGVIPGKQAQKPTSAGPKTVNSKPQQPAKLPLPSVVNAVNDIKQEAVNAYTASTQEATAEVESDGEGFQSFNSPQEESELKPPEVTKASKTAKEVAEETIKEHDDKHEEADSQPAKKVKKTGKSIKRV